MRKVLYISPFGGQWKVHWEKEQEGFIFSTKEVAIREARKIVGRLKEGEVASIRVQEADGTFQTEWTYGNDPYPPAG